MNSGKKQKKKQNGKTRDSSRKLEMWRMGTTKDRNGKDLK